MLLRLHEWRARRGYSIQELADRAHVSRMTVFRIESGRVSPTVAVLEKLVRSGLTCGTCSHDHRAPVEAGD